MQAMNQKKLKKNVKRISNKQFGTSGKWCFRSSFDVRFIRYDLMVAEGHVRGSVPKTPIIVVVIMLICSIAIHPVFLIGTAIAGIMVFMGFSKKSTHEEEVQRLKNEIESLKRQRR